jgi:hypothetical protein
MQEAIHSVSIVYKASGPDPGEEKEKVPVMFVQGYLAKQWLSELRQPAPSASHRDWARVSSSGRILCKSCHIVLIQRGNSW